MSESLTVKELLSNNFKSLQDRFEKKNNFWLSIEDGGSRAINSNPDSQVVAWYCQPEVMAVFIFKNISGRYNAYEVIAKSVIRNTVKTALEVGLDDAYEFIRDMKGTINVEEEELTKSRGEDLFELTRME